jgi:hypothetical protein
MRGKTGAGVTAPAQRGGSVAGRTPGSWKALGVVILTVAMLGVGVAAWKGASSVPKQPTASARYTILQFAEDGSGPVARMEGVGDFDRAELHHTMFLASGQPFLERMEFGDVTYTRYVGRDDSPYSVALGGGVWAWEATGCVASRPLTTAPPWISEESVAPPGFSGRGMGRWRRFGATVPSPPTRLGRDVRLGVLRLRSGRRPRPASTSRGEVGPCTRLGPLRRRLRRRAGCLRPPSDDSGK